MKFINALNIGGITKCIKIKREQPLEGISLFRKMNILSMCRILLFLRFYRGFLVSYKEVQKAMRCQDIQKDRRLFGVWGARPLKPPLALVLGLLLFSSFTATILAFTVSTAAYAMACSIFSMSVIVLLLLIVLY